MNRALLLIILLSIFCSCSKNKKLEKKGFQVSEISEDEEGKKIIGLPIDSLNIKSRPQSVLMTRHPEHRLTPIYKINYHKKTKKPFTGTNSYHFNYSDYDDDAANNWNNNLMPGYEAVYGYNMINVSHYNVKTEKQHTFFDKPVLIKTLYYPSFSSDTLNNKAVTRAHYMISVYDEDTNKDGYINVKDLRRFYLYNLDGKLLKTLIPKNHSVMSSEYDSANDYMYIFTRMDENKNGQMEAEEPMQIFYIDLKSPQKTGKVYGL